MKARVIALKKFERIRDAERNVYPKENEEWITSKERAEMLQENGVVKILEFINDNPIKEEKNKTEDTTKMEAPKRRRKPVAKK